MDYKDWKLSKQDLETHLDEYSKVAEWCNNNSFHIEDDGEYYKTVINPPLPEPTIEEKIAKLKLELSEIDSRTIRALRAIQAGVGTEEDTQRIAELEEQAERIREELKQLGA